MRYFLHLAYNGSAFFGWQIQPEHPTVQETLETCLSLLLHEERVAITGCGRTDTGVQFARKVNLKCLGQSQSFDSELLTVIVLPERISK